MLANTLISQKKQFGALAQQWLATGATAFEVWDAERMLAHWPLEARPLMPDLVAPIEIEGERVGELRIAGIQSPRAHTRLHTEAELVANLIQLEHDLETTMNKLVNSEDQLSALYQVTQSTRSHLNIDDVAQSLMRATVKLFKVEAAFVLFKAPDSPIFIKYYPTLPLQEFELRAFFRHLQTMATEVMINKADHHYERPAPIESLLFLPVPTFSSVKASLGMLNKWNGDFNESDLKLAQTIANQAGAQIENALLHQEIIGQAKLQTEMELAQSVQLQLLPQRPPQVVGLELAAKSRPASQVGGDFYDFILEPYKPFTFAVGDVSGKGMPAALLMAMTRTVIRSAVRFLPNPSPSHIMRQANTDLYDDFTEVRMFATVFVGSFDDKTGVLRYSNAGHSPVIFCGADKQASLLRAATPAIGVIPESNAKETTLQLQIGDVLVMGTDGFSEARNMMNEMFGYDRLLALVSACAKMPAFEIANALFNEINDFGFGRPQTDDQTVMVLKYVGK